MSETGSEIITVKFMAKGHRGDDHWHWQRQMPTGEESRWGRCRFVFEQDAREYDWLVAYDDLAPRGSERFSNRVERLACPREHSIFITQEPSSVKVYGSAFLRQFGHVLSSQEPWALAHPSVHRAQPALRWFYGVGFDGTISSFEDLCNATMPEKTSVLSTVCSSKRMGHTMHRMRYDFTQELKASMAELDVFGRGVRPINDKAEALDGYRYHLCIENHVCDHHWTEKLSDAFLGWTLPLYCGAPNALEYFPEESFVPIDIRDTQGAIARIREVIEGGEFEQRIDAIREAREMVLRRYNLFNVLSEIIEAHDTGGRGSQGDAIEGRHGFRNRHPIQGLGYLIERQRVRARSRRLH
ncbi:MAG: glycosyltransferase family 10 domain-containing protein [Phycisphaerales bacterium JB043]